MATGTERSVAGYRKIQSSGDPAKKNELEHFRCSCSQPGYDGELSGSRIRILLLESGQRRDPVRCHLKTIDLSQPGSWSYDALSYTWGSPTLTRKVFVNGAPLSVRENLWRFLIERRHLKRHSCLWIDAICINQQNNQERTDQVSKMGEIYATANEVSVWLGQKHADSDMAMKFLVTVLESSSMTNDQFHAEYSTARYSRHWAAVLALFRRPYWGRVWIIQEIINASFSVRIYCGRLMITWEAIDRVLQILSAEPTKSDNVQTDSCPLSRIQRELTETMAAEIWRHCRQLSGSKNGQKMPASVTQMTLYDLMVRYRKSSCTDMRDKIFALLGLVHNDQTALRSVQINYTKTLTEVFLDVHAYYAKISSHAHLAKVLDFSSFLQQLLGIQSPANHLLPLQIAQRGNYYTCLSVALGNVVDSQYNDADQVLETRQFQERATEYGVSIGGKNLDMADIMLSLKILQGRLDRCTKLAHYEAFAVTYQQLSLRISCEVHKLRKSYDNAAKKRLINREGQRNPITLRPKSVFLCSNGDIGLAQGSVDPQDIVIGFVGSQVSLIFPPNLQPPLLKSVAYMSQSLNAYTREDNICEEVTPLGDSTGLIQVEIDPLGIWALFAEVPRQDIRLVGR